MQNRNDRQNVPTLNRPQFSEDKMPEAGQAGSSWLGSKLPEIPGEQYFKPWHFKQMSISLSPPSPPFLQCSHIFFLNSHYLNAVVTQHRFQSFFFFPVHRTEQPQEQGFEEREETSSWVHAASKRWAGRKDRQRGNSNLTSAPALPTPIIKKSPVFLQGVRSRAGLLVRCRDPWSSCS